VNLPRLLRRLVPLVPLLLAAAAAASWMRGGFVAVVVDAASGTGDGLARLRELILSAGPLAPLVYVLAVAVEVVLAPVPGILLYAPGGAIFGGWWGGTLSLAGNVTGAVLAAWIGRTYGERLLAGRTSDRLEAYRRRLGEHGLLIVALLRVNPLTSSDLVSYAAGLAGVRIWRVAVGTAVGIAPLCYAQAHAAAWLFAVLPQSGLVVVVLGFAYALVVLGVLFRSRL
jgi:uncharacterized membrane protein YdjX (TVP38/TMEM64 family)